MRTIRTFVLRLLIDTDEPHTAVRGVLRAVADGSEYPFADAQTLLGLLQDLSTPTSEEGDTKWTLSKADDSGPP